MKAFKKNYLFLLAAIMLTATTSCSNDDEQEEAIYHQNYVQGKLNDVVILMNDINANIIADNSLYDFKSNDGSNIPSVLDWEVRLINTDDSVVTLYLHIDDLNKTSGMIYSPNKGESVQSQNTCYITIKNTKTGAIYTYHPTNKSPISAKWDAFMVTANDKVEKHNGVTLEYNGHQWPGIKGELSGTFTSDERSAKLMTIKLTYTLY